MIIEERLKNLPLIESIKGLPQYPGVYLLKGSKGEVLYIGKAKNIRSRVRSYFRDTTDTRYTVKFLASKVSDIEYLITTNEKEALILEDTLLKKYKPRYNIRLKDDKTYVSIKITLSEKYPRILITRQIKPVPAGSKQGKEGGRSPLKPAPACFKRGVCGDKYFGPYASAQKARETVKFTRRLFPLCTCSPSEFRNRVRPCLDYQLGICSAPCVNFISEAAYKELVDKTILFLEGRNKELLYALKANMLTASDSHEFERAAKLRDQITAIEATLEEQKVVSQKKIDRDIFAHIASDDVLLVQSLFIRDGRLAGARDFFFINQEFPVDEALSSFLTQYYSGERFIPDEIVISLPLEDAEIIEGLLSEKKGRRVRLYFPAKGERFKLLKMAEANAQEAIRRRAEAAEGKQTLMEGLQKRLRLRKIPKIIEAFDISNIGGKLAVGAMVTFEDAKPNKEKYRLYKIKTIKEPDDYGMLKEVMFRRYRKADKELGLPDLILMDGGKGQLNIALTVMGELGINDIDIAAIAKEKGQGAGDKVQKEQGEKVYRPNVKAPVILKEGSGADLFIREIRDEVHRFAIRYHKKLRGKIKSVLEEVSGIGKKRRDMLLKHFGSLERIKQASIEDIARVSGITISLAEDIKKTLTAGNA